MTYFILNTAVANIYKLPSHNAAVVTQALFGETCKILEREGNWINIEQWDGYRGWIYYFHGIESENKYTANFVLDDLTGKITNKNNKVLSNLVFGCQVEAKKNNDLFEIKMPDGKTGFSSDEFSSVPQPATRENILKVSERFLGAPYQWGGKSPFGMDCSGLVQTIFKAVGIKLPRDAYQQEELLREYRIAENEIQIGDLLFFAENERVTHVAIASGNHKFINAHGKVQVESIDDKNDQFNSKLRNLFLYAASIEELLKS